MIHDEMKELLFSFKLNTNEMVTAIDILKKVQLMEIENERLKEQVSELGWYKHPDKSG